MASIRYSRNHEPLFMFIWTRGGLSRRRVRENESERRKKTRERGDDDERPERKHKPKQKNSQRGDVVPEEQGRELVGVARERGQDVLEADLRREAEELLIVLFFEGWRFF